MKKLNKHGAKSLCAVIMAFALILLSVPVFPVHAENDETKSGDYKYAVTIEVGSVLFWFVGFGFMFGSDGAAGGM